MDEVKNRRLEVNPWEGQRPSPDIGDYVEQLMTTARKQVAASMAKRLEGLVRAINDAGDESDFVCGSLAAYNLMKDWLLDEELECMMRERGLND